ncbi:nitrite reductase small subunit NirD [Alginatibacterium sediminis]|uniref:Nitrite reductase (NADH) small subunit n=1 Tax=Alginatibacterium sediminis TaxID=2164068 RepID=A0A420EHU5_9ALTE|nr:nitrite reductase small subunit NirD [Alginatibacterium sediminis]RKF20269.1 nitrite reductase small subunit NirD [Alginatibacterium sediminis]
MSFVSVCHIDKIFPGTGVCALIKGKQVALFRPSDNAEVFALDNMDPFAKSNVLSRGLICEHNKQLWIASPLKKQRFNLETGDCLEDQSVSIKSYPVKITDGTVAVSL